jgi:hypothetical protein
VQGLAFVDIPAVEGLHQRASGEEMPGENETTQPPVTPPADAPAQPPVETPPATPPASPATPPAETPPAETPPADEKGVNDHRRGSVNTFRLNGVETQDFGKVQAHIDGLERTLEETAMSLRDGAVDDWVSGGKILGPQAEEFKKHCRTLSTEQFATVRKMYDDMPAHNLLSKHDTTTSSKVTEAQDAADALAIDREVIANFRRQGKDDTFIQKQPQWARVQAADAAK